MNSPKTEIVLHTTSGATMTLKSMESVESIGDGAFFGTAIRVLDVQSNVKKLGKEVLGIRKSLSGECEISKYLIKLDAALAGSSEGFNAVGEHSCGYVVRENGKLKLIYPIKRSEGKVVPLVHSEKMIFKALAYASVEDGDVKRTPIDTVKEFIGGIVKRK